MKKTVTMLLFILLSILAGSCTKNNTSDTEKEANSLDDLTKDNTETLLLAADAWLPYNGESGKKPDGFMIDIAREIFKESGIKIDYINTSWSRAIKGTEEGLFNGAVGASTRDGKNLIIPEEELGRGYLAFYVLGDDPWTFHDEDSLANRSIAVIESYDYREWLDKYILENRDNPEKVQIISGEQPLAQNLQKLLSHRIDIVVGNDASIRFTAKKMKILDKIKSGGFDQNYANLYIGFSPADPKSPEYAKILSTGISSMRETGRLDEILSGYGLNDWK